MAKNGFFLDPYKCVQGNNNWFKNLKFLGKGGNGTAFLVQGTSGPLRGGVFALKVFHMMSSEIRQKRFVDEVKFLKKSSHPNLMRHLDEVYSKASYWTDFLKSRIRSMGFFPWFR
jgi:serine/threonine-protein kinase